MKSIVIANPVGGSFNKVVLEKAVKLLEKKIGSVDILYTEYAGHATKLAAESDAYIIMCAGGDGIINEVVNGIEGKECVFFPLPFGTANVFCREHDIPINPLKAAEQVTFDDFKSVFLGKIANRYFVQMVGVGYDAEAVKNVDLAFKKRFGVLAYLRAGILPFFKNDIKLLTMYHKGVETTAYHAIFAVGKKYAGQFDLAKHKSQDKFLICYSPKRGRLSLLKIVSLMFAGLGFRGETIESEMVKIVGPSYCQLDGDLLYLESPTNFISISRASFMLAQ